MVGNLSPPALSSDGGSPGDTRDSSPSPDQQLSVNRSKAGIRVSLACVPCRSKHIKCDATLPTCLRCQQEQKPCYYAKSRRGIRDPRKRSLIQDKTTPDSKETMWPLPDLSNFDIAVRFLPELPGGWSIPRRVQASASPSGAVAMLLDSYYSNFYPSHSFTLPKEYLMRHLSTNSENLHFLINVFCYIGSLFDPSVASEELREKAFGMACGPLPMTPWTVQGLVIISIAAIGEAKPDLAWNWFDRAIQIALDIGMQNQSFAASEPDKVLAECHKRTFWGLFFHDCLRSSRAAMPSFSLYNVKATTDIPCEEWEYQSGVIPPPVSMADYDRRELLNGTTFSTWAYIIDIARLSGDLIMRLNLQPGGTSLEELERAEAKLVGWILQIPQWKTELVSPEQVGDLLLFHAIGFAHLMRIKIRSSDSRWRANDANVKHGFHLGPLNTLPVLPGPKPTAQWETCPPQIHAANAIFKIFALPVPPSLLSPTVFLGMSKTVVALLDACVFLGYDTPNMRERVQFGMDIIKSVAGTWPLALNQYKELKELAMSYLPPEPRGHTPVPAPMPAPVPGPLSVPVPRSNSMTMPVTTMGDWHQMDPNLLLDSMDPHLPGLDLEGFMPFPH